ncbi:MAG: class I SAM-dependent methyltransferase [Proteobacteria bacterium]|nr:class I SAM-dependent methyltransferase [Pseudomonadota bacterium]
MDLLQKLSKEKYQPVLNDKVLTHTPAKEQFSLDEIKDRLDAIEKNIAKDNTLSVDAKKEIIDTAFSLAQSEFGRFLIANNGALSGWWTYYCILGYKHYPITNEVEKFLLEESPVIQATRERFGHFQNQMLAFLENTQQTNITIASMPGGMAADLLTLEDKLPLKKQNFKFVNIDLDGAVFSLSKALAKQLDSKIPLECRQEDGWDLKAENEFDLIASNGLNIYEPNQEKIIALYKNLLKTLKPGGALITSALTPPSISEKCEWRMENIDLKALARQASIFAKILQAPWANFCTTNEMVSLLEKAGFIDIKIIHDSRNIFPTFVGFKP